MYTYFCKNCDNFIGKCYIRSKFIYFEISDLCYRTQSKNINSIFFLDCDDCDKFIGIVCFNVCENCFGEDQIFGEKKLYNWFQTYKKIIYHNYNLSDSCKNCNNKVNFRFQHWFFKELTFYIQ